MPTLPDRIAEFKSMALTRSMATFDVFDTLLHRTCSPETIILQTCRKIAAALYLELETVRSARDRAVAFLRDSTFAGGADGEYRFEDLGDRFAAELVSVTRADAEIVRMEIGLALSEEIRIEHECVYPDEGMVRVARELVSSGHPIAAISDMYHSRDTIVSLLERIGAGDLFTTENVFVSADYSATKASGKLYAIVLERFGMAPGDVVHIGDNHASDYLAAEDCGIRAVHYDASAYHERYKADHTAQTTGRDIGLAAHEAAITALDASLLSHRIAAAVAPVLCQFALEVAQRSKELDVDSVWFMARDGYLPMKLYELFDDGTFPLPQYLYVSRKSVSKASSNVFGTREAFMAQWNGESRKLRSLLAPFELDEDLAAATATRYGFRSLDEDLDYATDPRFHRLMTDAALQQRFTEDAEAKRASLLRHLEKSGFMSQRHVSVVDVGWAGQIQEALELAIDGEQARPHVTGLYMALRGLGGYRRLAGHDMEGLIYDCSHHDWLAASIFNAVDVFEDTCRAHHGTVLGYDENGDAVLATDTVSRIEEIKDEPRLSHLQSAILLYAKRWIAYVRRFGVPTSATKSAAVLTAARLTRFPTAEEANYYTSMGHSLDVGSDSLLARKGITGRKLLPRIGQLRSARWKEAAAADYVWGRGLQFLIGLKRQMASVGDVALPAGQTTFVKDALAQCGLPASLPPSERSDTSAETVDVSGSVSSASTMMYFRAIECLTPRMQRSTYLNK
ncbi:HAD hydrolase-like protein [Agrobacterium rubi]|nr:HAD hydrolase-like protein [Agrobacterium rubi]NTF24674.1 HAD hydrolase-like protein [Agrobacterium rubi]